MNMMKMHLYLEILPKACDPGGGGGGGGTLIFFLYVGLGLASTIHPQKISGISSTPKKIFEILATPKNIPHSVPYP